MTDTPIEGSNHAASRNPAAPRRRPVRWLALVLLVLGLSFALDFYALDHGDPCLVDRCLDAPHPLQTLGGANAGVDFFSSKALAYPPLVTRVSGLAQRAWIATRWSVDADRFLNDLMTRRGAIVTRQIDPLLHDELALRVGELIVVSRAVVAFMGVLCVLSIVLLTRELFGRTAGLVAGLFAAIDPTLILYSHTGNVDVPYVALSFLAIWLAARAARRGAKLDLWLAFVFMGLAISAKDQAYGLFALSFPFFLWRYARGSGGALRPFPSAIVALGVAIAVAIYISMPGIPIRWDWLRDHLAFVRGAGSEPFRATGFDLAGLWHLTISTVQLLALSLGIPLLLLGGLGLLWIFFARRAAAAFVVSPILSYAVTFLVPIGYVYLRFTIPVQLLLVVGAAAILGHYLDRTRTRHLAFVAIVLLFGWSGRSTLRLERLLREEDPRTSAGRFLRDRYPSDTRMDVVVTGTAVDLVLPPWKSLHVFAPRERPSGAPPSVLVTCEGFMGPEAVHGSTVQHESVRWLDADYRRVAAFQPSSHDLLVESVLWLPRIVFYEAISPPPSRPPGGR